MTIPSYRLLRVEYVFQYYTRADSFIYVDVDFTFFFLDYLDINTKILEINWLPLFHHRKTKDSIMR